MCSAKSGSASCRKLAAKASRSICSFDWSSSDDQRLACRPAGDRDRTCLAGGEIGQFLKYRTDADAVGLSRCGQQVAIEVTHDAPCSDGSARSTEERSSGIAMELMCSSLRQGEVFGLSPDDIDFAEGIVHVRRQVKLLSNNRQLFGLPKGRKTREVPLPESVADAIREHLMLRPPIDVTLPWERRDGARRTFPLLLTTREKGALNRNYFNTFIWHPALEAAGVEANRASGMHALRHFYASTLLDAGESIKAVSEYLGHADPGFTLRTYTHLMPTSDERTKKAIDRVLGVPNVYPRPA